MRRWNGKFRRFAKGGEGGSEHRFAACIFADGRSTYLSEIRVPMTSSNHVYLRSCPDQETDRIGDYGRWQVLRPFLPTRIKLLGRLRLALTTPG